MRTPSFLRRSPKPGLLAVVPRKQRVEYAHVVRSSAGPRLAALGSMPRHGSDADDLTRLRRSLALSHHVCTTRIARAGYQTVQVTAPKLDAAEWRDALRWAVKDTLSFPAEDALIEPLPIPVDGAPAGRDPMTFVIAAQRSAVADRVRAFQRAGLPLATIDVAETAQRNVAALFEQPGRGLALLALDENGALLTFTRDGELFATRHIDVALAPLHDTADAERRQVLFERFGLEMQRSLDNFDRQFSQIALQRVLVAAPAGSSALLAYLGQNLYQPVEAIDLGDAMDLSACPQLSDPGNHAAWLLTIGLALRDEATA